jgi:hypothetical protein
MKSYELHLPVFKQGDDLHHKMEVTGGNLPEAFKLQAETYELAAEMCRKMAGVAVEHELSVDADTHMIMVGGPEDVMENLVVEGILDADDEYEDEDE